MTLLEVSDLACTFSIRGRFVRRSKILRAVDGVSFAVQDGEILGIVGETGCGKSTLAKMVAGIQKPTAGSVIVDGIPFASVNGRPSRSARASLQYVYQDPGASLDPRWKLRRSLHEPLVIHTDWPYSQREAKVREMISSLDLSHTLLDRYPDEISGGQQRRMGLARILVLAPKIAIFDEPTSGLDILVQESVLTLLRNLRREFALTYLLISHDIAVVRALCDRVAVMHQGRIVEIGPTQQVLNRPAHPYTQILLAASLRIGGPRLTDRYARIRDV